MKFSKMLYVLGTLFLFLGLLWMFLPHAIHGQVFKEEETEHLFHILEGAVISVLGLALMIRSKKKISLRV